MYIMSYCADYWYVRRPGHKLHEGGRVVACGGNNQNISTLQGKWIVQGDYSRPMTPYSNSTSTGNGTPCFMFSTYVQEGPGQHIVQYTGLIGRRWLFRRPECFWENVFKTHGGAA